MVNRLIEHAVKTGDKKAVTTLHNKQMQTQIIWKDKKNPYYQQNELFKNLFKTKDEEPEPVVEKVALTRKSTMKVSS